MTLVRMIVCAAVLALCAAVQPHAGIAAGPSDIQTAADDQGQKGGAAPAGAGDQKPGDVQVTPLQQCQLGCGDQCKIFNNPDLAEQCRDSCQAKCTSQYGK